MNAKSTMNTSVTSNYSNKVTGNSRRDFANQANYSRGTTMLHRYRITKVLVLETLGELAVVSLHESTARVSKTRTFVIRYLYSTVVPRE
jgi:hypothetical protein